MKITPSKYFLTFWNANRVVWGVPDFMSEEEGQDFLHYLKLELESGAKQYFSTCCRLNSSDETSDGEGGMMSMNLQPNLMPRASDKTKSLLMQIERLVAEGRRSMKQKQMAEEEAESNQTYRGMGYGK